MKFFDIIYVEQCYFYFIKTFKMYRIQMYFLFMSLKNMQIILTNSKFLV